ncbi:MAG TPA: hypothetical protein VFA75_09015 [Nevskia sp.]|nr:hypothetical protein [Nevskia sp.]
MPALAIQLLTLLLQEAPQLMDVYHKFVITNGRAPTADELKALATSWQVDLAAADQAIQQAGPG